MENATDKPEDGWELLGSMIASSLAEAVIDNSLSVKNYFLFSVGRIEGKTVSIGILGHVFTGDVGKFVSESAPKPETVSEEPQKPMGSEFFYADGSKITNWGKIGVEHQSGYLDAIRRDMEAKAPKQSDYLLLEDYYHALNRWNEDPLYGWLEKNGEEYSIDPFRGNLRVYTTINPRMQKYAENAVVEHLKEIQTSFDKECKYRKNRPYMNDVNAGTIEWEMRQARKWSDRTRIMSRRGCSQSEIDASFDMPVSMKVYSWKEMAMIDTVMTPNDSILYCKSLARAALIAMNPATGEVQAYVGNEYGMYYDFARSKHAVGSAVQPFIYALAMEEGMTPCSTVLNVPQTFSIDGNTWTPRSSDPASAIGKEVTLKWGLCHSSNNVSAYLVKAATPDVELQNLKRFRIPFFDATPSISVGSGDASLYDLTAAYNVFVNKGKYVVPVFVSKITDLDGNVLYKNPATAKTVISEESAYYVTDMLQAVVDKGIAAKMRIKYNMEGEAACKTGQSIDLSDTWFIGSVPHLSVGVWTGWESRYIHFASPALGSSANTSLPIWAKFVMKCQEDSRLKVSKADQFSIPKGITPVTCTGDEEDVR